jgi:hypothetical protein
MHIFWYIGTGAVILALISAELHWEHKHHPTCMKCGASLNKDNTVHQDGDDDICIECYARQIAPEYYYEDR